MKTLNDYLLRITNVHILKRLISETVTRTCNGWNTNV